MICQSVLSKSLGPISEWLSRLEVSYHSGYNIIHFTLNQLLYKISNSSYSITDHPEAAYNLVNSPHLKPAALLDSILIQFTVDGIEDKLLSKGISSKIKEHHLELIRHYLIDEIIPLYHFSESDIISALA